MKVHLGSGSVYLGPDWVNIDIPGPHTFLAKDRPDLVVKWATTDDNYFGRHSNETIETLRTPRSQEYVCDAYGSFDNIPGQYWSVDEVLARHSFEHLSITEARKALDQIDGIMKPGGILRLDVPDHEGTLLKFRETGDEFYIRHLLGPRRDDHGFHMMSYTRERLKSLVEEHGFVYESEEPNIHVYPAFCLRFRKPGPRAPRDYVKLPDMPDTWKMLDVGPGEYPHPRADVYLDHDRSKLEPLKRQGKKTMQGDVMNGLSEIPDKAFDFIWMSHCMEHLSNPAAAAAALSRIGKRGVMIVPSAWKESLNNFEEAGHLWQILPNPDQAEPPIFVRKNGQVERIKNIDVMKSLSRVFRTGPNGRVGDDQRLLRRWWFENEASLDIVYFWEDELRLQVIG